MAKLYCSEACWRIVDDAVQIRGGRGYETARSLRARGEAAIPVERMLRDTRINLIIEGTSQIMRLFIAREALDAHMRLVGRLMGPGSLAAKLQTALAAAARYAIWYPRQWVYWAGWPRHARFGRLASHLRFVERTSHRLARMLFHAAVRHQTGLAKRQQLLGRLVDVGSELLVMTAACAKAQALVRLQPSEQSPVDLADVFCRLARRRVAANLRGVRRNEDRATYRIAQEVLSGRFTWLESGIV